MEKKAKTMTELLKSGQLIVLVSSVHRIWNVRKPGSSCISTLCHASLSLHMDALFKSAKSRWGEYIGHALPFTSLFQAHRIPSSLLSSSSPRTIWAIQKPNVGRNSQPWKEPPAATKRPGTFGWGLMSQS